MRTDAAEFDGEFNPVPNGIYRGRRKLREREKKKRKEEREKRDQERITRASIISSGGSFFKLLWDE